MAEFTDVRRNRPDWSQILAQTAPGLSRGVTAQSDAQIQKINLLFPLLFKAQLEKQQRKEQMEEFADLAARSGNGPKGQYKWTWSPDKGFSYSQTPESEIRKEKADVAAQGELERFSGQTPVRQKFIERLAYAHPERLSDVQARLRSSYKTPEAIKEITALGLPARQRETLNRASALRRELNTSQIKKDYDTINRSFQALEGAYAESLKPGTSRIASDQALGVLFQKMLDPQSVVRESEYARTPEGAAFMNRMQALVPQMVRGGLKLADADRKAIYDQAKILLDSAKGTYEQQVMGARDLISESGMRPESVLGKIPSIVSGKKGIKTFKTEAEAEASGYKGDAIIAGRPARID